MYGQFELAHFKQNYSSHNETKLLNITSLLDVDSGDRGDKIMFRTPVNRSFQCAQLDPFDLSTHIHYSFPDAPSQGTKLNNTQVVTKKVQFDAFRPKDAPHKNFQVFLVLFRPSRFIRILSLTDPDGLRLPAERHRPGGGGRVPGRPGHLRHRRLHHREEEAQAEGLPERVE